MVSENILRGKNISLRSVEVSDAEFILPLRLDPTINEHLNKVSPDIELQREWIRNQRERANDYYFIILDKENNPIGTVGLYDINRENGTFNWGRWIVIKKAPLYAAIETTLLIYRFGFEVLELEKAVSEVRTRNVNVVNFHLSYGAIIYKVDAENIFYYFPKSAYANLLAKFKGFHNFTTNN
jgi:RimJ/RimL family protein N-acetyltransferase